MKYETILRKDFKELEVTLMGDPLDANTIANLSNQLLVYDLNDVKLVVKQGPKSISAADIKSQVLEDFMTRHLDSLSNKEEKIAYLTRQIVSMQSKVLPMDKISKEAVLFDGKIQQLSVQETVFYNQHGQPTDTLCIALTKYGKPPKKDEINRFERWLKTRIETDSVRVIVE